MHGIPMKYSAVQEKSDGQFVIHKHIRGRNVHWDLMIDSGDALWTWRIESDPQTGFDEPQRICRIFDHDRKFLNYQGPVNQGNASVEMIDKGVSSLICKSAGSFVIDFQGKLLAGRFELLHICDDIWQLRRQGREIQ